MERRNHRRRRGKTLEYVYDDEPQLYDNSPPYTWWKPSANIDILGYGANGFWFTLAAGNNTETDNSARWDFEPVVGRYEVQVFVPADWATAHAQYRIWVDEDGNSRGDSDEYVGGPLLNQEIVSGWQTLGQYELNGAVIIVVRDNETLDDWRDVDTVYARLAADVIRLKKVD